MKRRVMVFGTFDVLHPGHIDFFQQAKRYGQELIVVVARDATTRKVKGRLPMNSERDRRAMVAAVTIVHRAVLGDQKDQMKVVRQFTPDVVCLGYDQRKFVDTLRKTFPKLKTVRLKAYRSRYYKSSKLK